MADPTLLFSSVKALVVVAFKSSKALHDEIKSFRSHPSQIRRLLTELSDLTLILRKLSEAGNFDLDSIKVPLEHYIQACNDVKTELRTYCSRFSLDSRSFRDWHKLKYGSSNSIEEFRQLLHGYKSTFNIALGFLNL
jgi:hypothetical protein